MVQKVYLLYFFGFKRYFHSFEVGFWKNVSLNHLSLDKKWILELTASPGEAKNKVDCWDFKTVSVLQFYSHLFKRYFITPLHIY